MEKLNIGKYCPIVIDCETSGCDSSIHAILEIALVTLKKQEGLLTIDSSETFHVLPFEGAQFDKKSMDIHQIDPYQPLRFAVNEQEALTQISQKIQAQLTQHHSPRGILVGHNAWFDLAFLNAAFERTKLKSPLHRFTTCDTATLGGFFYNETVLARALYKARISYNPKEAHGALYDAYKTAQLYCHLVNKKHKSS